MAWNGSGTYTRTNGTNTGSALWAADAAAAVKITTSRHDTHDEDLATAINACLTQNNESKPTADFSPNVTATYDLGSTSLKWVDGHFSGDISAANVGASNVKLNSKTIDIGTWDMDTSSQKVAAHGLTLSKIRKISALIRDDADSIYDDFASASWTISQGGTSSLVANATNIVLTHPTSGRFDSTDYNDTAASYNRGWITIQYTD